MIHHGDCLDVMAALDAASVDSIVTDPPYGLKFMGKTWDHGVPGVPFWSAALRVARPGSFLLAFGGTRTWHRLACAIEDSGWEIRDTICWLYGQGFPKGKRCLKPAWEPIIMARKAGPGELQVEACRLPTTPEDASAMARCNTPGSGWFKSDDWAGGGWPAQRTILDTTSGRWPANVCLDEEAAGVVDEEVGFLHAPGFVAPSSIPMGKYGANRRCLNYTGDGRVPFDYKDGGGGPSRFFYCAKASRAEREAGLGRMPRRFLATMGNGIGARQHNESEPSAHVRNPHPTVKPLSLMRWLVRLVAPPGGTVLDPFAGSGTTGCAAALEGFQFVGIEKQAQYVRIAEARIAHWNAQPSLPMEAV